MRPVNPSPQPSSPNEAIPHAIAARFAVRALLKAKAARDPELAGLYARLAAAHLDRHLADRRSRLP